MNNAQIHIKKGAETCDLSMRKGLGFMALKTKLIEYDCKKADCGICIVHVRDGMEHLSPPTPAEADFLRAMHADPDERLACQCRVFGDVSVEIEEYPH